jgi:predicted PurR-regulated permease PerM
MINTNKDFNKYFAMVILIILAIFICIYIWPYINGFFGAFILFALFLPVHRWFIKKLKINKNFSAVLIIILTILLVIIPSYFIIANSYTQVVGLLDQKDVLISQLATFEQKYPGLGISNTINKSVPNLVNWTADILFNNFSNIMKSVITLLIMYFLLFYLLVYHNELYKRLKEYLPFSTKNSILLAKEFTKVTYATLITTGLVAIFQGLLLGLGFWIFNIKGAVFWGLLAAVLSFLPILGVPLIWIPFVIIYLVRNNISIAIGILILGLIINYSEYFIRPYLQRKIGDLHPLISIIGIFIGVAAFGFVGIVMGPLILSYFTLTFRMFKEEYLKNIKK